MGGFVYENGVKGRSVMVMPNTIGIITKGFLFNKVEDKISFDEIASLELINMDGVKGSTVGAAGAAGFLVAGPLGAAAGAALGALSGTAVFLLKTTGGESYVFELSKADFNKIEKRFKVKQALASA